MARVNHFLLGILILQIYVHAAPSNTSKIEDNVKGKEDTPKLDADPKEIVVDTAANNSSETQRQKRWYNPYGYGFPPISPVIYPSYNKRDEGPNTGYYGAEDPLVQIHRRIQEIANIVRQPPPPPPPHIPIFYPILFIPAGGCNCNTNPSMPDVNVTSKPDTNETDPSINNRWPEMDDERQNWGIVVNETDTDDGEDFTRPISFDPIRLNRPVRPPPPVEHGTVQSDSNDMQEQPQSTTSNTQSPPTPARVPSPANSRPQNASPSRPPPGLAPPSPCDGAILTCCHQPQVSYDCFAIQGCPDFTSYPNGNPCDPNLILRVIQRFQAFYGTRNG